VEHKDLGPACKVNTYRWGDGALSGDDITIGAEKVGLKKRINDKIISEYTAPKIVKHYLVALYPESDSCAVVVLICARPFEYLQRAANFFGTSSFSNDYRFAIHFLCDIDSIIPGFIPDDFIEFKPIF